MTPFSKSVEIPDFRIAYHKNLPDTVESVYFEQHRVIQTITGIQTSDVVLKIGLGLKTNFLRSWQGRSQPGAREANLKKITLALHTPLHKHTHTHT